VHDQPNSSSSSSSTTVLLIAEHVCRPITFTIGPRPAARGDQRLDKGRCNYAKVHLHCSAASHRTRQDHPGALAPQPKAAGESRVRCHFCPGHQKTHYAHPQVRISPAASFAPKTFLCACRTGHPEPETIGPFYDCFVRGMEKRAHKTCYGISQNCRLQRLARVLLTGSPRRGCLMSSRR